MKGVNMRLIYKIAFMSWLCVVLIQGDNLLAQETTVKQNAVASVNEKEKINFPEVEGWKKGKVLEYPFEDMGNVVTVSYTSEKGGKVTIYVYNSGHTAIPNDISNDIFTVEMANARDALLEMQKRGYYRDLKETISEEAIIGGQKGKVNALHSVFIYTEKDESNQSEIYLFPYKNNFIKIRATRPNRDSGKQNEAVAKLLGELDTLFSK